MQLLTLIALSFLLMAMAHANSNEIFVKIKIENLNAGMNVQGLETYFGEQIAISQLKSFDLSEIANKMQEQDVQMHLTSGEVYNLQEIEYALVPDQIAVPVKESYFEIGGPADGFVERAPHNPGPPVNEKAPHEQN